MLIKRRMAMSFAAAFVFLLISHRPSQSTTGCLCKDNVCYTVTQSSANFDVAQKTITIHYEQSLSHQSKEYNYSISVLLSNLKGHFWVGLRSSDERCPQNAVLPGWATGNESTNFTRSKEPDSVCSQQCVSVSGDLTWKERPCQDQADGFLCEYRFSKMCNISKGQVDSQTLLYRTPLGLQGSDLILVPPGSILTLEPSGMKIYCVDNDTVDWIQGPWNCEIEKGGCEHQCEMCNGKPQCTCPPYMKLEENKVRCKNFTCKDSVCEYNLRCENNLETNLSITGSIPESTTKHVIRSCSSAPCEHICSDTNDGYKCSCSSGFLPDPEKPQLCLRACTNSCPPIHDINDPSASTCPKGFVLEEENCIIHDTCEKNFDCSKCTHIDGLNVCYCERGFFSPTRECDRKPFSPNIILGTAVGAATAAIVLILIGLFLNYCVHRKRAVSSFETTTNEQKMVSLLQVKTNR